MKLNISPTLSLDVDTFVTSTQAIVAKKGSGKTYKANVEAEELLDAGQQVIVIDPTSAWWGLRSSADGRSAGYPITIFGGDHGDLVLEANGGGFNNYISALRGKGYVDGEAGALRITDAGLRALGEYTPLPTGRALFEHWLGQLGKAEREILRVLYEEWPQARPKDFVAVKAGYAADGGGFNNALSRLRTLELIEGKAKLKASDQLHEGARA